MKPIEFLRIGWCFFLLATTVSAGFAQSPVITGLFPPGGPRGATTAIQIDGQNLIGSQVRVRGKGLTVRSIRVAPSGDRLTVQILADTEAWLGPHELRLTNAKGISNGVRFWVDTRPNLVLAPMQESDLPQVLDRLGQAVINGRIERAAGRDRFFFTATAGEQWVFQCAANRFLSRFDPVLELRDEMGRTVTLSQGAWESDPVMTFRAATAGKYTLTVRDSEFKGGTDFTYRLTAGVLPLPTGFLPRGGSPGKVVTLNMNGPNLSPGSARVEIPTDAPLGAFWADARTEDGHAITLPLLVDTLPVSCGTELGDMALPVVPVAVDGNFSSAPTVRYKLHAPTKQALLFDLLGRRIGSRIDGMIRVLDSSGKEIAANDDAVGKDARLEFNPPSAGDYVVELSNVEEKTGPECFWRLVVRPNDPDFRIELRTDRVQVPAGGTISLPVEVIRSGGYAGPIELRAEGLPKGVTSTCAVVPPDKINGEITFAAVPDAVLDVSNLRVIGSAKIGEKALTREARGWEEYEHRSIDQVLAKEYSYTRPHHDWEMLLIAVTENKPAFTVNVEPDEVALNPGGKCEFRVKVDRKGGNPGVVKLSFHNLPQGVSVSISEIPEGKNEIRITLTAAPNAPAEIPYVIITGTIGNASATSRPLRVAVIK